MKNFLGGLLILAVVFGAGFGLFKGLETFEKMNKKAHELKVGDCFTIGKLESWDSPKYKTYYVLEVGKEKYFYGYLYYRNSSDGGYDEVLYNDTYKRWTDDSNKVSCPAELVEAMESLGD